jgi:hypothetical protein
MESLHKQRNQDLINDKKIYIYIYIYLDNSILLEKYRKYIKIEWVPIEENFVDLLTMSLSQ